MDPYQNNIEDVGDYLRVYLPYLFGTAGGLTLVAVALLMFLFTLATHKVKWVWLSLLLYSATLQFVHTSAFSGELLFPFGVFRSLGRPLTFLFLVLLLLPTIQASRGARWKIVAAPAAAYLIYELWFSFMLGFGSASPLRGVLGGLVFLMVFAVLGVGVSRWTQTPAQVYSVLRCVIAAVSIILFATAFHLVSAPSMVIMQGRLLGTTSNANVLAGILAFTLPMTYGLLLRPGESPLWRVFLAAHLALSLVFLIWTGARSGVMISLIGALAFFRWRLGQFTRFALVAAVLGLLAFQFFGDSLIGGSHLLSTSNSRTLVYEKLWETFLAHPVLGAMSETVYGESVYLSTAAAFGIVGCVPLFLFVFLTVRDSVRALRRRPDLGRHQVLVDIAVATVAEILIGSVFENHLMGTMTYAVFVTYLCLTVQATLLDSAVFPLQGPEGSGAEEGYGGAYAGHELSAVNGYGTEGHVADGYALDRYAPDDYPAGGYAPDAAEETVYYSGDANTTYRW